jgi:hypothetical protein
MHAYRTIRRKEVCELHVYIISVIFLWNACGDSTFRTVLRGEGKLRYTQTFFGCPIERFAKRVCSMCTLLECLVMRMTYLFFTRSLRLFGKHRVPFASSFPRSLPMFEKRFIDSTRFLHAYNDGIIHFTRALSTPEIYPDVWESISLDARFLPYPLPSLLWLPSGQPPCVTLVYWNERGRWWPLVLVL